MMVTRRSFSTGFFAPLTAPQRPDTHARRRVRKQFKEIAASLYPWDLLDEGCSPILDTLGETTGANSTYLVALMHWEKRPLTDWYYPHNPKRKTYFPEDSRAYWKPRLEFYRDTKIKPRTSDRDELKRTDWLEMLVRETRKRGWKTGAEISHTVLDQERARGEHVDTVQRDVFGNPIGQLICPNNADARNYLIGLFTDLVSSYDLDFIQTCLVPFAHTRHDVYLGLGGDLHPPGSFGFKTWGARSSDPLQATLQVTLGGCFCSSCESAARNEGFDLKAARRAILRVAAAMDQPDPAGVHHMAKLRASNLSPTALMLIHPEIFDWLKFRANSMTRLFRDVHAAIAKIRANIDLRLNAYISTNPELAGLNVAALAPYLGSIRSSDYSEQAGVLERLDHKREFLLSIRAAAGDDIHFLSAIGIRPKATPELIRKGVAISSECGADGLSLGHYDGAPLRNLEAIKEGMLEADIALG